MQLIPEWAPNIHPLIIHFPIVLLITAVFFDLAGILLKKFKWLEKSALVLYVVGTLAIIITFFSGQAAANGINIPAKVIPAVSDHADWAEITLWFFIIFLVSRLLIFYSLNARKPVVNLIAVAGLIGLYFLYQTGDHGAKLVYGYGLGTGNILAETHHDKVPDNLDKEPKSESAFIINKDGSWKFTADSSAANILKDKFELINSTSTGLSPIYNSNDSSLTFNIQNDNSDVGFVYDSNLKSIEAIAVININNFKGEFNLAHHFQDINNYDFLGLNRNLNPAKGSNEISLSRKSNGHVKIFEKEKFENKGWIEVKVIINGDHFRGYINNKLIVHGHGNEPQPGKVGIIFSGIGKVKIKMIKSTIIN